jgi:hypothetical protein
MSLSAITFASVEAAVVASVEEHGCMLVLDTALTNTRVQRFLFDAALAPSAFSAALGKTGHSQ